jgi:muconolactone D-isomerase
VTSAPNDMPEFLVNIALHWGEDLDEAAKADITSRERARAAELAASGHLLRIWRVPGQFENWGLWRASDMAQLDALLSSLPARAWMTRIDIVALAAHPSDPAPPISADKPTTGHTR